MSYRTDLTQRLISILFRLVRRPHSRQELAQIYGVDVKTISRDLDALSIEYQITAEKKGRELEYRFTEDFKFIFPKITVEEIATLLLAEKSIIEIGIIKGSKFSGNTETLLEKLEKSLPATIRKQIKETSQIYGSSAIAAKDFSKHTQIIDQLTNAAIQNKKVKFKYHSLNKDENNWRILEPYSVYFDPDGSTLKLIGFETVQNRIKVFSIERISNLNILEESFRMPIEYNLDKYLEENCFNGIFGEPIKVRLKAKGITARIFAERKFHPSQKVIEKKQKRGNAPETITIEMRVAGGRGLERFIIGWLPDIEVISPKELRESVKQTLLKGLGNF